MRHLVLASGLCSLALACVGVGAGDGTLASGETIGETTTGDGDGDAGDGDGAPGEIGCTPEGAEIVGLINAYRMDNGKPAIPLSPSLCMVGHTHAVDLADNSPHTEPGCNLHSWSARGAWTPCCYTADHAQAECMWAKPGELTMYPGSGYENAYGGGGEVSPAQAVDGWKGSPGHNDVMLNQGIWADYAWGAIGAGLYQGYAVVWFGVEADPAG